AASVVGRPAPLPCTRACHWVVMSVLGPATVAVSEVSGCAVRSVGVPLTCAVNVIVGVWPGPVLVIDWMASATVVAVGDNRPVKCLSAMPTMPPVAGWHTAHDA